MNSNKENGIGVKGRRVIAYTVLIILTFLCLIWFYILVINATRTNSMLKRGFTPLPSTHLIENMINLLFHSTQPVLYMTVFSIVVVLITIGVVHGQEGMGQQRRTYRLMDELIAAGSGRQTAVFEFKNAKVMLVGKRYIELQGRLGAFRAYVPEEDFDFVRNYIQYRVPMECEIRHEAEL